MPNEAEQQKLAMQEAINAMADHAIKLYNLMQPGMTISVSLEKKPLVIAPNVKPEKCHIIITRPVTLLGIELVEEKK